MSRHWLKPNWEPCLTLPELPITHFLERNIKLLILDADKTLVNQKETHAKQEVNEWIKEARKKLDMHILSNNPSKKRVSKIASNLSLPYTYLASKPRSASLKKVLKFKDVKNDQIAIIGDRIFTDIILGNRMGIYTVLVKPVENQTNNNRLFNIQQIEKYIAKILGAEN